MRITRRRPRSRALFIRFALLFHNAHCIAIAGHFHRTFAREQHARAGQFQRVHGFRILKVFRVAADNGIFGRHSLENAALSAA